MSSIRERAAQAACALHTKAGRADTCEVGVRTSTAVLTEVGRWLRELALVAATPSGGAELTAAAAAIEQEGRNTDA